MKAVSLLCLLVLLPLTAVAGEVVIQNSALTPAELTVDTGDPVMFVNSSGHRVHIEFAPRPEGHHVFQIPELIRATFHRAGRHPYVVHFESGAPHAKLWGIVNVHESPTPSRESPVCRGVNVEDICIEP